MSSLVDEFPVNECNDISLAIGMKSEIELRRALVKSPRSINQRNTFGQTALHLAVDWPRGMVILLEAGADVNCQDSTSSAPLKYVVRRSLVESLRILIRMDCSVYDQRGFQWSLLKDVEELCTWPFVEPDRVGDEVFNLVVDLLIEKRKRLCYLARSTLIDSEWAAFARKKEHEYYLIDENLSALSSTLLCKGIPVPSTLDPDGQYSHRERKTIYHDIPFPERIAERLWTTLSTV